MYKNYKFDVITEASVPGAKVQVVTFPLLRGSDDVNTAEHLYFADATLYERDSPVFKKFVPILRAINFAGWRPLRSALLTARTGVPQPPPDKVFVERFGSVRVGTVFWTAHNGDNVSHSGLSLLVETAALGFAAGSHRADELTMSAPLPALHVNSSTHSSLALPP